MSPTIRKLTAANSGLKFTESPRWYNDKLWLIDIHDKRIKTVDLTGNVRTELELPFIPNAFGLSPTGAIIVGDAFSRKLFSTASGTLKMIADLSDISTFCLSDGIVDRKGRVYVGDIGYNFVDPKAKPVDTCVLALIDSAGKTTVVADNLFFPNGIVISPDGQTLIVGETLGNRLTAFSIRDDGSLFNRRIWAQLPNDIGPDGICLDEEGGIWCANPAGEQSVVRVCEGGTITHKLKVDTHAYAVMLGGPERKHLFICTSASHDPEQIHKSPSAHIQIAEVDIPGAGTP